MNRQDIGGQTSYFDGITGYLGFRISDSPFRNPQSEMEHFLSILSEEQYVRGFMNRSTNHRINY